MPGKRTDYKKLDQERAAIVKSMEQVTNVPQSKRLYPNFAERVRRTAADITAAARERLEQSEDEARARRIRKGLGNQPASVGNPQGRPKPNRSPV